MIKILNPKPISEIEELREKGLYNAPFSVQEAANGTYAKVLEEKIKELEEKIVELEGKEGSADPYDDSELKKKVEDLEKELAESNKTVGELNADLDALVGGSDE